MALTALTTTAAWTGAPLFALWVGSQAQGDVQPTMQSVVIVVLVLAVIELFLVAILANLSEAYDREIGRRPPPRRPPPWYSSMRGERDADVIRWRGVNGPERVVAISVAVALLALEIWFFFFSVMAFPT